MNQKRVLKGFFYIAAVLSVGFFIFLIIFCFDNKYILRAPVTQDGKTYLDTAALSEGEPLWLAEGWELYPDLLLSPEEIDSGSYEPVTIFIGQYLSLSSFHKNASPYGTATYRLMLKADESAEEFMLYLPEIFSASSVFINGRRVSDSGSVFPCQTGVRETILPITLRKNSEIVIQTSNYSHYYSGIIYTPALGNFHAILRLFGTRIVFYGLFCFSSLASALLSIAFWACSSQKRTDRVALLFGILAASFSSWICYPFFHFGKGGGLTFLYSLEDSSSLLVTLCAFLITTHITGTSKTRPARIGTRLAAGMLAAGIVVPLFVLPAFPAFSPVYGKIITLFRLSYAVAVTLLSLYGSCKGINGSGWLLWGTGIYASGLFWGAVTISTFEPARFCWMEEYGAFSLVLCFGILMVKLSYALRRENQRLTKHLQAEVLKKTAEISSMTREREELISGFLHDMKSPVSFMLTYARTVLSNDVMLDPSTREQLAVIEEKCRDLDSRVREVQQFTAENPLLSPKTEIELYAFLRDFYRFNRPDVEMDGQTFLLDLGPQESMLLYGDEKKLKRLLQNLIYNAVSFTPPTGSILLSLRRDDNFARITVSDTGCGISEEEQEKIFRKNYTTRMQPEGRGMGLYIVKTIVTEHGGNIRVTSSPGKGTSFLVTLPFPL